MMCHCLQQHGPHPFTCSLTSPCSVYRTLPESQLVWCRLLLCSRYVAGPPLAHLPASPHPGPACLPSRSLAPDTPPPKKRTHPHVLRVLVPFTCEHTHRVTATPSLPACLPAPSARSPTLYNPHPPQKTHRVTETPSMASPGARTAA